MIAREITQELKILLGEYPVVTILGPRQSGKTTLSRGVLSDYAYSNLEHPETRELATSDPKAYLKQFSNNVIIDEIQRVPELLSYIQTTVDEENKNGRFVLTGSHQLQLREAVSQTLAGRTAVLNLLPFSIKELKGESITLSNYESYCFTGFLPRIYDRKQRPGVAYSNYYRTYVERDVRQLINLKDLSQFEKFLKLLAGRSGQVINYSSLANDIGVTVMTVKSWLSILEASFIVFKLSPYYENFNKRVIKSPKYYFMDVGLLCFLLGIHKAEQVCRDPLVGNIFENMVVIEALKSRYNKGHVPDLYYFRDSNGNEVDIIFKDGRELVAIEVKSATTFSQKQLQGLRTFSAFAPQVKKSYLIYNGDQLTLSDNIEAFNFKDTYSVFADE